MGVIDVDALLAPVSMEAPAGADMEFDPAFFELDKLAQGTPESVMGDEVKPAEEPEFPAVKAAALAVFEKTRDLRVAMLLTTSLLKVDGLAGFLDGVNLIKGFLAQLWDQFYPKLDPEDNNDPTIRINILKAFEGNGSSEDLYKFKLRLREATLTNSAQKIGAFGYRDIQIANGEIPAPSLKEGQAAPADMNLIHAAFEDTPVEDLQATQAILQGIVDGLVGIDTALGEKVGPGIGPDFTEINDIVGQLQRVVHEQLVRRGVGEAPAADASAGAGDGAASGGKAPRYGGGGGVALTGEIASRDDVVRVLDKICEYYERFEPTSPVPIFMQRAKRLVGMSFVDMIRDLAPEAMPKIEVFTGTSSEAPPPASTDTPAA